MTDFAPFSFFRACRVFVPAVALAGVLGAKPISPSGLAGSLAANGLAEASADLSASAAESPVGAAQFETLPSPLPANVASIVFAPTGTSEFGDLVRLTGASHFVGTVSVMMSSGARHADFANSSPLGFTHPLTLTLYAVDRSRGGLRPGEVLARLTEAFLIPWRAETGAGATLPGRAFTVTFDLAALGTALPDEVIYGVSFDTQYHGTRPVGRPGPYDLLGLGLTDRATAVGTDPQPDAIFWRNSSQLEPDLGWAPFKPAVRFTNSSFGTLFETVARLEALRGPNRNAASAVGVAASLTALALDRTLWEGNGQLRPVVGRYVFELLAEASDELARAAAGQGTLAAEAQSALETIRNTVSLLAETAVADAMIFGGNARNILRAQTATDDATDASLDARHGEAVDHLGRAWQEAQSALR